VRRFLTSDFELWKSVKSSLSGVLTTTARGPFHGPASRWNREALRL